MGESMHKQSASRNHGPVSRLVAIALWLGVLAAPPSADAAVPAMTQIDGVLQSVSGGPIADGSYNMTFSLYPSVSQGVALYVEGPVGVNVKGGFFVWTLGSAEPLKSSVFANASSVWLGVKIESDPELPRKQLMSVPFSLRTGLAEGLDCSGCVTAGQLDPAVLAPFAKTAELAKVATSGKYLDLLGAPDLSLYAQVAALASVATTGKYTDLTGTPDLSGFAKAAMLANVAFSGSYADLGNKPDLSIYAAAAKLGPQWTAGLNGAIGYSSGYVGVGTTKPAAALDVTGDARITGKLGMGGLAAVTIDASTATDAVAFPRGTTAQRPANAVGGYVRFNTDIARLEYFDGTSWQKIAVPFGGVGGTVTTDSNGYKIHTFSSSGTFTATGGNGLVDVLIVGGGGGGSNGASGGAGAGGGAGGLVTLSSFAVSGGATFSITVGTGGTGGSVSGAPGSAGSNGGNSAFGNTVAVGGGGGGASYGNLGQSMGQNGGSGGGGGVIASGGIQTNYGSGTNGQGNHGGSGTQGPSSDTGGGGGGAGSVGQDGAQNSKGGNGGSGVASAISGATVVYAGGGAGGMQSSGNGGGALGGTGGGGAPGVSGANGLGGGGGGGSGAAGTGGGNGGAGVVIVRYLP